MKTLITNAVIEGPEFYYAKREEHRFIGPEFSDWLNLQQKKIADYIAKAQSKGPDGELVATLDATVDGKVLPTVRVTGIDRTELNRFQRFWYQIEGEILDHGETNAKRHKDREHGQHGHK